MRNYILPAALAVLLAAPLCWRIGSEVLSSDATASVEEESLRRAAGITFNSEDEGPVQLLVAVPLENQSGPLQVRLGDAGTTADIAAPVSVNYATGTSPAANSPGAMTP